MTEQSAAEPARAGTVREPVSAREARAAARAYMAADRISGRETPAWIVELAES